MKLSTMSCFALLAFPFVALAAPMPESSAVATPPTANFGFGRPAPPANPAAKAPAAKAPAAKAPAKPASKATTAAANTGIPTSAELVAAAEAWRADTMKVSHYLNIASTLSGQVLKTAAAAANVAEKDELTHKAVIDRHPISKTAAVVAANNMLVTEGHFQAVVDALTDVTQKGTASKDTPPVINANRCPNVLFAIDAYLRAANTAAGGNKVANPSAVRPVACGGPQQ
ncbi:hypothetical protein HKX48_001260 [Thoreauomyces humboldtii]|nr:hypothetical protein HKX48_001260 [Thoreauomyces humboldtii]